MTAPEKKNASAKTPIPPTAQPVVDVPSESAAKPIVANHGRKSKALIGLTLAILIVALAWFLLWFFYLKYYESTDDAYVNGNLVNLTAVIKGTPIAFFADDTDLVKEGQILVLLDPTDQNFQFDKELSTLASTVLQVNQLFANVEANKANVLAKRTQMEKARYDFENRQKLVDSLAVSKEDFQHASDAFQVAEHELSYAEQQLQAAQDAAGNTTRDAHPLIEAQKARVRSAFFNLYHTTIRAPVTGYVAKRTVQVGQRVSTSDRMMSIIPSGSMWVDANFKETQLTNVRIGQPATITFDLYGGDVEFRGEVLGIASGTGSVFSLIPPQNATGNWIKIVQRLAVRISLDPEMLKKYPLRLGLSANVTINTTQRDLPALAQVTKDQAVESTTIFEIEMKKLEAQMVEIVQKNLETSIVKGSSTPAAL